VRIGIDGRDDARLPRGARPAPSAWRSTEEVVVAADRARRAGPVPVLEQGLGSSFELYQLRGELSASSLDAATASIAAARGRANGGSSCWHGRIPGRPGRPDGARPIPNGAALEVSAPPAGIPGGRAGPAPGRARGCAAGSRRPACAWVPERPLCFPTHDAVQHGRSPGQRAREPVPARPVVQQPRRGPHGPPVSGRPDCAQTSACPRRSTPSRWRPTPGRS
jgi:hypothetical protein